MITLIENFWAVAAVFGVALAALSYVVYLAIQAIAGGKQ